MEEKSRRYAEAIAKRELHKSFEVGEIVPRPQPQPQPYVNEPASFREILVAEIEMRQSVEMAHRNNGDAAPSENHRRLVEAMETLQALDAEQVQAPPILGPAIADVAAVHHVAPKPDKVTLIKVSS